MTENVQIHANSAPQPTATGKGIICSTSPLAASAGIKILQKGGNAFDAAIAVAAAETVTLPPMCGIGGEVFALLYQASTKTIYGLTGSGRAPMRASREHFLSQGYDQMPSLGPLTPAIPGEVDAWGTIWEKFGSISFGSLLEPAIALAENGFPIATRIAGFYKTSIDKLRAYPSTFATFTRSGEPFREGDILIQPNLANSLKRIEHYGFREFYEGELAEKLIESVEAEGGLFTKDDLAGHKSLLYQNPPSVTYRDHTIVTNALPSQGLLILQLLNIMEGLDLKNMGHNSPDSIHALVEAKKLVFADRLAYLGDPEYVDSPIHRLLSKSFANRRREMIPRREASNYVHPGALPEEDGDTSYFCIVDKEGNAVSFIHSLSMYFGSGFIAGNTGVLLNDRVGRGFYLQKDHPNMLAPGKKTINTIQTWMAFKENMPVLIGGTPGGDRQPPWNAQIISNVLDYGMNPQQAVEAPRWSHFPGTDPATVQEPYSLRLETTIPPKTKTDLENRGHNIANMPDGETAGAVQLIAVDSKTGIRTGAADPRADGYPLVQ